MFYFIVFDKGSTTYYERFRTSQKSILLVLQDPQFAAQYKFIFLFRRRGERKPFRNPVFQPPATRTLGGREERAPSQNESHSYGMRVYTNSHTCETGMIYCSPPQPTEGGSTSFKMHHVNWIIQSIPVNPSQITKPQAKCKEYRPLVGNMAQQSNKKKKNEVIITPDMKRFS